MKTRVANYRHDCEEEEEAGWRESGEVWDYGALQEDAAQCRVTMGSALVLTEAVFPTCAILWLDYPYVWLFTFFSTTAFSLFAYSVERNVLMDLCWKKKRRTLRLAPTPLVMHPVPLVRQMLVERSSWEEGGFPYTAGKKISRKFEGEAEQQTNKKNPNCSETFLSPRKG